jgi:hypothetical protein
MTVGSYVHNHQVAVSANWAGCNCIPNGYGFNGFVGEIRAKSWNGGDTPPAPHVTPTDGIAYRYLIPKNIIVKGHAKTIYVVRKRYIRPPRQKKPYHSKVDHAYTMTAWSRTDSIYQTKDICSPPQAPCFSSFTIGQNSTSNLGNPGATHHWDANDDIKLIAKIGHKLQGEEFNLAVFLGEGKESLATIVDSAVRIRKALSALRSGNPVKAFDALLGGRPDEKKFSKRKPKEVLNIDRRRVTETWFSNNWLQLQYGWKPLLNDVYGAAGHLAYMQNRPQTLKYRVSRSVPGELTSFSPSIKCLGEAYTRKGYIAKLTHVDEIGLVGLTDPASLAWELLPYSFVVDWFIPVGNYLQQKQLSRSISGTYVLSEKRFLKCTGLVGLGNQNFTSADLNYELTFFTRTVLSSLPVPTPVFKGLDKVVGWAHATNSVALLVNFFSGGKAPSRR